MGKVGQKGEKPKGAFSLRRTTGNRQGGFVDRAEGDGKVTEDRKEADPSIQRGGNGSMERKRGSEFAGGGRSQKTEGELKRREEARLEKKSSLYP